MNLVRLVPLATALTITALSIIACSPQPAAEASASVTAESAAVSMASVEAASATTLDTSAFTGKWTGVEGTYLTITPQGNDFQVTVVDLDGPRQFTGTAEAGGIRFTRDGKSLLIHKGNGVDTGMKWLVDKKDCLVVDANEGYCRD